MVVERVEKGGRERETEKRERGAVLLLSLFFLTGKDSVLKLVAELVDKLINSLISCCTIKRVSG